MTKLYNDNCINIIKSVIEEYGKENVIIVSDPPFNVNYHYDKYKDNMPENDYFTFLTNIFSLAPAVIIHYPESLCKLSHYMNSIPEKIVSWCYTSNLPRQHRDIYFFGVKPDFNKVKQPYQDYNDPKVKKMVAKGSYGCRIYDWWQIHQIRNISKEKTHHPCQMPLEVMERVVGVLPENKIIIDPFMGSGTTGVACKQLKRDFIGIEIDENYYTLAKKRIDEYLIQDKSIISIAKEKMVKQGLLFDL